MTSPTLSPPTLPLPHSQWLSLRGCRYVDGSFLLPALQGLSNLRHLDLAFTMTSLGALDQLLNDAHFKSR